MNSEGSNLRPVTLAELQATETRISNLVSDLISWIEATDSRSAERVARAQHVLQRINRTISAMNHEISKSNSPTTPRMFSPRP